MDAGEIWTDTQGEPSLIIGSRTEAMLNVELIDTAPRCRWNQSMASKFWIIAVPVTPTTGL